ncbi:MAG: 1-deoxy-D-xylulose-5-phosphate reductoisomerase [Alphaproteobacteria bacterium]|nr:1-deoxy-D-xylulose-5-phosphate reductoisomerase [Alphaproteobacteria bacterium]MAS46065.1 1-deoxy-D-xylulose-5-phosphate reductoisomerase [Alphaproteobacteria bacterium]MBN54113.1 1-deoxy-D-xylulose-5-phosphate reductoisomerase [Alphaproteobacteria bacterium]OUT42302.1 MAG: 1-deoxy-D-xylulose-5-phosphate reductoisomerase [Micavibrio sp. TMED2]|tara:strand:- start:18987 stop:20198 length:1212 start_codon:yes stop_codon:yes gene_type:complete
MTDPVTSLPNAIDHTVLPAQGGQRSVAVLGATGSIGCNTLDIIAHHPDRFRVACLTANRNAEKLIEQARRFRPDYVAVVDAEAAATVREVLSGLPIEVGEGPEALVEAAERDSDIVVAGIVGAAGLPSTLAAARRGAIVALANKEALVCAGPLMTDLVRARKATLLPVDSEHNAIFQVFENHNRDALQRIILTASGGPFRTADLATMQAATPAQAVAHPTWSMGAKISVDSATMMNKGLEIIEAHFLFDLPIEQIDVVIHPQSVIHSMVEYNDGSVLAQMGTPDMRTPIAHCLGWPNRVSKPGERLDFSNLNALTFEKPDHERFPCLNMARAAISTGGTAPTILNAANEIAVAAFLDNRIGFMQIPEIVERTVAAASIEKLEALEQVFAADHWARQHAGGLIG